MTGRFSSLAKPSGVWWHALNRDERLWVGLAVIWGLAMFVMIAIIWPLIGPQQNEIKSARIEPANFRARTDAFIAANRVGEIDRVPVVAPPPGSDVYLEAQTFLWRPVLQLKRGQTYHLLLSSRDLQHGFSLVFVPHSLNYQVLPGYITEIEFTPQVTGEFPIVCNEYCGLGHHNMTGRIIVTD